MTTTNPLGEISLPELPKHIDTIPAHRHESGEPYDLEVYNAGQMNAHFRAGYEAGCARSAGAAEVGKPFGWVTTGPNGIFSKSREMLAFCQGEDVIPLYDRSAPAAAPLGVPAEAGEVARLAAEIKRVIEHTRGCEKSGIQANEGWRIADRHIDRLAALAHPTVAQPETPVAAQVAIGEADDWVAYVNNDGFLIERHGVALAEGVRLYLHPATDATMATERAQAIAEAFCRGHDAGWQSAKAALAAPAPVALAAASTLVRQQAEDDGLWFKAQTAPEAYLQKALRDLHAAVEANPVALAAVGAETPLGEGVIDARWYINRNSIVACAKTLIAALDQPFRYPHELKAARDALAAAIGETK